MAPRTSPRLASRLDRRVTLERSTPGTGGALDWSPVATLPASITTAGGAERESASHVAGVTRLTVTIRWRADVTSADRLVLDDGRVLRLVAVVDPDERHVSLELVAEEEPR